MNRATENDSWIRNPDGTLGFTSSPITGCLHGCPFCFARSQAFGRLREKYMANENVAVVKQIWGSLEYADALSNPFFPRFWPSRLDEIKRRKQPAGIFLCIMGELFGEWVPRSWQEAVFETIRACLQHRFYLLTKQPQNLGGWTFPKNCWVGVTATEIIQLLNALFYLEDVDAPVKFLSLEPVLYNKEYMPSYPRPLAVDLIASGVNWVIIGACTGSKAEIDKLSKLYPELTPMPWNGRWTLQPQPSWLNEIVEAADKARVAVFLKDNLLPLQVEALTKRGPKLRQELPELND